MPRFYLLDPSLIGVVGHHHEFAHNVLSAASKAGWQGVLAGHQQFPARDCGGWPVLPLFRDGLWTHQTGSVGLRAMGLAVSALRRAPGKIARLASRVQERRDEWRAARFAADVARLLRDSPPTTGDLVFVPNATVVETLGVALLLRTLPAARAATWHLEFHFNIFEREAAHRARRFRHTRLLQGAVRRLRQSPGGHRVYLYTDTDELSEQHEALHAGPFFTLPIPVDPVYPAAHANRAGGAAIFPVQPAPTESANSGEGIAVTESAVPRTLTVAYVGDARGEKGYPLLPGMIREVWPQLVETKQLQFRIQSNCRISRSERPSLAARDELGRLAGAGVKLLTDSLSTEEYRKLVLESDILLLPYSPDAYEARSSGILSEALAAGKPVVVSAGTWMATQLRDEILKHRAELRSLGVWPAGKLGWDDIDASTPPGALPSGRVGAVAGPGSTGLAAALCEVVAHFEHYRATAENFASGWNRKHSAGRLVEMLVKNTSAAHSGGVTSSCVG